MEIVFDPAKNAKNIATRQLSFERAADLDWHTAMVNCDERKDYGEKRFIALAYLDGRLHIIVFTETSTGIRVISFRKANERERRHYEQAQTPHR